MVGVGTILGFLNVQYQNLQIVLKNAIELRIINRVMQTEEFVTIECKLFEGDKFYKDAEIFSAPLFSI